ncbi:MAG TPA: DUF4013 domain-containing protein [Candidatus Methanomethylicus sp.]|nr:DUF4013 domain-containing protein [Candidatus Methanomethylicus sp.]
MKLADSLSFAFDYTKGIFSKGWDLIILTVISIIPILNLITAGYAGRVIKDSSASKQPPAVRGYWGMFVDGLKVLVAGLLWSVPVILVALAVFAVALLPLLGAISAQGFENYNWTALAGMFQHVNGTAGNWTHIGSLIREGLGTPGMRALIGLIPATLVVVAAAIVVWFFAITGIVHMFKTGSFAKAFAVGEIYHLIGRIGILRYLGWIGVAIVLGAIIGIFDAIPVIGWLISAFLSLLLLIFIARSIGLIYDDVTGIPTAQTGTDRAEAPAQMPQGAAVAVAATAPASASAPASTEAQQKVYCVHCGAENRPEFKYCFKCGKEIFRQ